MLRVSLPITLGRCLFVAPVISLGGLACSGEAVNGPEELTEDRGVELTAVGEGPAALAWSADGTEVYYRSCPPSGPCVIKAVSVDDKSVRVVDPNDRDHGLLTLSVDGKYLYYRARPERGGGGDLGLYRVLASGGDSELLIDSVLWFSLSPDNAQIAFSQSFGLCNFACDSLFLYSTATQSRAFLTLGEPRVFSPGGDQLLFIRRQPGPDQLNRPPDAFTVSIETGETEFIPFKFGLTRWDSSGISVLHQDLECGPEQDGCVTRYFVFHAATNTSTKIWEYYDGLYSRTATWSSGGQKAAVWTSTTQHVLHLIDIGEMSERVIAVAKAHGHGGAFSSDGRRIAYTIGSQLYMTDCP
jgi:dipeptidyl aminopeptidase/acylaminoacyl peptidase